MCASGVPTSGAEKVCPGPSGGSGVSIVTGTVEEGYFYPRHVRLYVCCYRQGPGESFAILRTLPHRSVPAVAPLASLFGLSYGHFVFRLPFAVADVPTRVLIKACWQWGIFLDSAIGPPVIALWLFI